MYDTRVIHRDNGKEDGDHHIRMGYIYVYIYIYIDMHIYIYGGSQSGVSIIPI